MRSKSPSTHAYRQRQAALGLNTQLIKGLCATDALRDIVRRWEESNRNSPLAFSMAEVARAALRAADQTDV